MAGGARWISPVWRRATLSFGTTTAPYAPPSATKAEVGVRVRPARYIEAKQ
jgi:hypothetical protein